MIESVHAIDTEGWADPHQVKVQFDKNAPDVGVGVSAPHDWIEQAFADQHDGDTAEFWMRLDRSSVNRLIRLLRKARDETFGKDE